RELHRAGGRSPRAPRANGAAVLTASELRVARLAAQGATNRTIADELVVTPHTVRFHLANVYRKLAVAGREELAAALHRL
ncbi:MAG: helix-turn-helix transcriptional regulator, partial [Solirubrobacterales bacterium]|nr:helix-turn-helix transcriptional regulator [Solirubrobacterales bacterium]